MEEQHPSSETLRRFFSGDGSRDDNAWVIRHLVAGCAVCQARISALPEPRRVLSRLLELPDQPRQSPLAEASYEWAFARANRTVSRLIERAQRKDKDPIAELLLLPRSRLLASARRRFATPEAVKELLDRSFQFRFSDPKLMLLLAQLAQLGADACGGRSGLDAGLLADLRAQAWSNLASALRVNGRQQEAREPLRTAEKWLSRGSGNPLIRAYVLERKAVQQYSLGNFDAAISTAADAARIYSAAGKTELSARASVSQAIALHYSGQSEEAIRVLHRVIPQIDGSSDALLLLSAYHNLAAALLGSGQAAEAISILDSVRDLYRDHPDLTFRLRARSLHGDLLLAIGHLESAEKALLEAVNGLAAAGLEREVAFTTLTLAEVYAKQGDRSKLGKLLTMALPMFRSFDLGPGPRNALARLQAAAGLTDAESE